MVIVIDEAGFGTAPFRKYGYSLKGEPCFLKTSWISHNMTLIAAISDKNIEGLQLFYKGGTTSEVFD